MTPHRLRQYRAFDVLMQTGSVTRAAESLLVSQPAVTKLLQSLEDELSIRLFDRSRRRLAPTTEAVRLHREVEQLLLTANHVDRVASQIRGAGAGEIRIVALPMLGARFLPEVIAEFCRDQPALQVSLRVLVSRQVRAAVLSGEADLGFTHPSKDEHLARHPLPGASGVAILPPGHRLAGRSILRPADFEGEPFISLDREHRLRDMIDGLFESHGVSRHTAIDTNLIESACELVAAGAGVSIVDWTNAAAMRDRVVVRPIEPVVAFKVEAVRPISSAPSGLIDSFLRLVDQRLGSLPQDETA